MQKSLGRVCLLLAALCLFSFGTGAFFCCSVADHDCCGEGCSLCLFISLLEQVMGLLSLGALFLLCAPLLKKGICRASSVPAPVCAHTPVRLKVKLSD